MRTSPFFTLHPKHCLLPIFSFDLGDPMSHFDNKNYLRKQSGVHFKQVEKVTKYGVIKEGQMMVKLTSMTLKLCLDILGFVRIIVQK